MFHLLFSKKSIRFKLLTKAVRLAWNLLVAALPGLALFFSNTFVAAVQLAIIVAAWSSHHIAVLEARRDRLAVITRSVTAITSFALVLGDSWVTAVYLVLV